MSKKRNREIVIEVSAWEEFQRSADGFIHAPLFTPDGEKITLRLTPERTREGIARALHAFQGNVIPLVRTAWGALRLKRLG